MFTLTRPMSEQEAISPTPNQMMTIDRQGKAKKAIIAAKD